MKKQQSVSLKEFSAIRIGGVADIVYFPETIDELTDLLVENPAIPVVGGGTNVFFGDVPDLICTKYLNKITETPDGITAECGALLAELFDFSAGVPATVGGGIYMNFGAFGFELKDFLLEAQVLGNGIVRILPIEELNLGYRSSNFSGTVLSAVFKKRQLDKKTEYLNQRQVKTPWGQTNIGSIFQNPVDNSAGVLIEQSGLKGYIYKDLQISEKHANIIVNNGSASAEDMLFLINYIKETVKTKMGIELQTEVKYIGG
jgi:UDP-N-acetylmuramate dehydrogenase